MVEVGARKDVPSKDWAPDPMKYVALPAHSRILRVPDRGQDQETGRSQRKSPFNFAEINGTKIGVIASGASYFYAKEVFGETLHT